LGSYDLVDIDSVVLFTFSFSEHDIHDASGSLRLGIPGIPFRTCIASAIGLPPLQRRPLERDFRGICRRPLPQRNTSFRLSLDSLDDEQIAARALAVERAVSASASIDPDRARLLPRLAEAVPEALAVLPPSDRLLLSLYYVQGLTLAQIARTRGVHEATASRRLQNIRSELREQIESVLARGSAAQNGRPGAKGLSPAEIRRCLDYALEDWPFDLSSALAEDAVPGRTEGK
jgi:RNA polymerase sigma factor (sigma-70 family)